MSGEAYRQMALAELAHSDTFFGHPGMEHARRLALLEEDTDESAAAEAGTPLLTHLQSFQASWPFLYTEPTFSFSSADCFRSFFNHKVLCLRYWIHRRWTRVKPTQQTCCG